MSALEVSYNAVLQAVRKLTDKDCTISCVHRSCK